MFIHRQNGLLVGTGMVVVMMMVVVVTGVFNHHHLRLRRKWYCETAEENSSQKYLFHTFSLARPSPMR